MQQITGSKKYQNGIQVFWTGAGEELNDFFRYDDLVDQKINALDLLNNPRLYLMNAAGHRIESVAAGCSFATATCEDEIIITRLFDAPRDLAWRAWTEPELVMQWWDRKTSPPPPAGSISGQAGLISPACGPPMAGTFGAPVFTGKLKNRSGSSARTVLPERQRGPGNVLRHEPGLPRRDARDGDLRSTGRQAGPGSPCAGIPAGEMRDLTRAGWDESLDKFAAVLGQAVFKKTA